MMDGLRLVDSPVARSFQHHIVREDTLHPTVLRKMDSWVVDCDQNHAKCADLKNRKTLTPTRLLDLSSLPSRQDMIGHESDWQALFSSGSCRLIENAPGTTGRYVALSYCWGNNLA
jgi:hypothetical protein